MIKSISLLNNSYFLFQVIMNKFILKIIQLHVGVRAQKPAGRRFVPGHRQRHTRATHDQADRGKETRSLPTQGEVFINIFIASLLSYAGLKYLNLDH